MKWGPVRRRPRLHVEMGAMTVFRMQGELDVRSRRMCQSENVHTYYTRENPDI